MRNWEDIVKERLEGYESPLPEGCLAEFHSLRSGSAKPAESSRFLPAWTVATAIAAGIAAVLVLHNPASKDDISIIVQPSAPLAVVTESPTEDIAPTPIQLAAVKTRAPKEITRPAEVSAPVAEPSGEAVSEPESKPVSEPVAEKKQTVASEMTPVAIPANEGSKPVRLKVGQAAGAVAGGGSALALVAQAVGKSNPEGGSIVDDSGLIIYHTDEEDALQGPGKHSMPLKLGLSTRFGLTGHLSLTTGLQYSLYSSQFNYSKSGEVKQNVSYLGIPLRLDWTLASNRWLDVYVGAGAEADYCLGATWNGKAVEKDAFDFSLLGAGGVQLNVTRNLGIFVEPELSWTVPNSNRKLTTYRTEKPVMFSVATGLRYTFGK